MNWEFIGGISIIVFGISLISVIITFLIYINSIDVDISEIWWQSFYWIVIASGILLNISIIMIGRNIKESIITIVIFIGCAIYSAFKFYE